jgi:iron complex outermembrane receptor protein
VEGDFTVDSLQMEKGYFGQFTVDLSQWVLDGLHFTAGYRWSESHNRASDAPLLTTPSGFVEGGPVVAGPTVDDQAPSWNFSLDYQIKRDMLVYVASRRGFIPGGRNLVPPGDENIPGVHVTFRPETLTDAELGLKYDWMLGESPVRTNIAIYQEWWNDVQQTDQIQDPNPPFTLVSQTDNIAAAKIQGLELESQMNATERLSFSLSYSYINAKYTKFPGFYEFAGQEIPKIETPFINTPRHQGTVGGRYQVPLGTTIGTVYASADYYRQSAVQLNPTSLEEGSRLGLQKGYGQLNVQAGWDEVAGQPLDLKFFMHNALNDTHMVFASGLFLSLGTGNTIWAPPRMWGVEFRYRFGGSR